MKTPTSAIKAKLDEILRDYLDADTQIEAGLKNGNFYGTERYHELTHKKNQLLTAHQKLTDALVTIERYM